MATRKRSPTTAPGNGGRSRRGPKGVTPDVLARLQNLRSRTGERAYLDPTTGIKYSERTVANTRAGGVSKEIAQFARRQERALGRTTPRVRAGDDYAALLKDYQQAEFLRTGKRPTLKQLRRATTRSGRAFSRTVKDLASGDPERLERALVALGRRPPDADWKVGDSPKVASFVNEFRESLFYTPNYRPDPKRKRADLVNRKDAQGNPLPPPDVERKPTRKRQSKRARVTGRN